MKFTSMGTTERLFELKGTGNGWCGLLVAAGTGEADKEISIYDALRKNTLRSSFLFMSQRPVFGGKEEEEHYIDEIETILKKNYCSRAILWLTSTKEPGYCCSFCGLSEDGTTITKDSHFRIEAGIEVLIKAPCKINLTQEEDGLEAGVQGQRTVMLAGRYSPQSEAGYSDKVLFKLWGEGVGDISYVQGIPRNVLADKLNTGFQLVTPYKEKRKGPKYITQWYPFFSVQEGMGAKDLFLCKVMPLSPKGTFDGGEDSYIMDSVFYFQKYGESLTTWYMTPQGERVDVIPLSPEEAAETGRQPAGFVPVAGPAAEEGAVRQKPFVFAPVGDYIVVSGKNQEQLEIMCGLNGVEKLILRPKSDAYRGDSLRFYSKGAAFVPVFPLPDINPLGTPVDLSSGVLDARFFMSYATAAAPEGTEMPCYVAQPDQARLFGRAMEKGNAVYEDILYPKEPGIELASASENAAFPMLPCGGTVEEGEVGTLSAEQILEMEKTVLSVERKRILVDSLKRAERNHAFFCHPKEGAGKTAEGASTAEKSTDALQTVVTPSGVLADIDAVDGRWKNIQLGQYEAGGECKSFGFTEPDMELQQAFSSSQLCLVIAGDKHLPENHFCGWLELAGWEFAAQTGKHNRYGEYPGTVIVKNCRGTLLELMNNPAKWTMPEEFGPSDKSQLAVLAQWIVQYMKESADKGGLYENFNRLVQDENWSGVLILKAAVTRMPQNLRGLTAGLIKDRFFAHHLALEFSDIDGTAMKQKGTSAISGLIDYSDVAYDDSMGEKPVPPGQGDYDFKVLRLKCLFEHSSVKSFYSLAQISLQKCFGSVVTAMADTENSYKALLLHGSYQNHGGASIYRMTIVKGNSPGSCVFLLDNKILKSMGITGAQMNTKEEKAGSVVSLITLEGFLSFEKMEYKTEKGEKKDFDIYSYGGEMEGLEFRELAIQVVQEDGQSPKLTFEAENISFDSARTKAREGSLIKEFAMEVEGILVGGDKLPKELGYLPVTGSVKLSAVEKNKWYGLKLSLDMGSPGALASQAGFKSEVLLAWGTENSSAFGFMGLKLPGAASGESFFSLENVLRISVGNLRIAKDEEKGAFILILTNIALKFLGIASLPPGGSTCFYLFADPEGKQVGKGLGWYAAYNKEQKKEEIPKKEMTVCENITSGENTGKNATKGKTAEEGTAYV